MTIPPPLVVDKMEEEKDFDNKKEEKDKVISSSSSSGLENQSPGDETTETKLSTSSTSSFSHDSPRRFIHKKPFVLLLGVTVVMAVTFVISGGALLSRNKRRNSLMTNQDSCIEEEPKINELWTNIQLELTFGSNDNDGNGNGNSVTKPLSKENQVILESAIQQSYNTISNQGCNDKYKRWMVDSTLQYQELITIDDDDDDYEQDEITSLFLTVGGSEAEAEGADSTSSSSSEVQLQMMTMNHPTNKQFKQQLVTHFDLSISCDECTEQSVFADIYPEFFLENDDEEDEMMNLQPGNNRQRELSNNDKVDTKSNTITTTSSTTTATTTTSTRNRNRPRNNKIRGATSSNTVDHHGRSSTSSSKRSLQETMDLLNGADIIKLIEQTAIEMGFVIEQEGEDNEFQSLLEAAIILRDEKLQISRNSKSGSKGDKKLGKQRLSRPGGSGGGSDSSDDIDYIVGARDPRDAILPLLEEIVRLVIADGDYNSNNGNGNATEICNAGWVPPTSEECTGFITLLEALVGLLQYSQSCFRANDGLLFDDLEARSAQDLFNIFRSCSDSMYGSTPFIKILTSNSFCPIQFNDGASNRAGNSYTVPSASGLPFAGTTIRSVGYNQYAWTGHYNEQCQLGIMVHSGGSQGEADTEVTTDPTVLSAPTITVRNEFGTIIYQDLIRNPNFFVVNEEGLLQRGFPILSVGIRSGLLVDCNAERNEVTIVLAVLGPPGSLIRYTINMETSELSNYRQTILAYPSIRGMTQLQSPNECQVVFAPLFNVEDSLTSTNSGRQPIFQFYNWCNGLTDTTSNRRTTEEEGQENEGEDVHEDEQGARNLLETPTTTTVNSPLPLTLLVDEGEEFGNGGGSSSRQRQVQEFNDVTGLEGYTIWDYECQFGRCWAVLLKGIVDPDSPLGTNIIPELYTFEESGFSGVTTILLSRISTNFEVPSSGYTLEPIDETSVLVCTQSGFIYQSSAAADIIQNQGGLGGGGTRRRRRRDLQEGSGLDARAINQTLPELIGFELNQLELDLPQECRLCRSNGGGPCIPVPIPQQLGSNAYIWQAETCGNYVFIGSLDISGIVGAMVTQLIFGFFLADPRQFAPLTAWIRALIVSRFFKEKISPYDFGFGLYYIDLDELKTSSDPEFFPVTVNGFRGLGPNSNPLLNNPLWPPEFPFSPLSPIEAGVRSLVCHTDAITGNAKLMVGTAVFGPNQSSSTWVLDVSDPDCAPTGVFPDPIPFVPGDVEADFTGVLLNPWQNR